jgi:hypothetical protein
LTNSTTNNNGLNLANTNQFGQSGNSQINQSEIQTNQQSLFGGNPNPNINTNPNISLFPQNNPISSVIPSTLSQPLNCLPDSS